MPLDKEGKRNPLFYFHGFNSAIPEDISSSPKISAVADFCRATGRAFLPQNIDYRYADRHSQELLDSVPGDVDSVLFCGASMGGWFARIMQLLLARRRPGLRVEAVVFNPAFNLAEFSHHLEGHQLNYVTGAEHDFTPEHGAMLVALEHSVDYGAKLPFWVYVDRDDEVINAEWSRRWHSGYAHFLAFPGGCHSFDHAREALENFQPGCWNGPGQ
ncbi:MAG: YqiA/YcfP family alpha/beta fold hydrolase [Xanthomonadales bacterium]|jgi:predicted esterase YcpF (UPF0227 family)|nr:YqiA/YcfP family alpha/beta fold hydrolase [Xanthomonadales bacterium]